MAELDFSIELKLVRCLYDSKPESKFLRIRKDQLGIFVCLLRSHFFDKYLFIDGYGCWFTVLDVEYV